MAKKKNKIYRTGAYKRLSQDDGRGEVSNSIINQTELIKDYGKRTVILKSLQSTMTMVIQGRILTVPAFCG